jgi:branched-chain amino acid transport system substrate-binding protein
VVKLRGSWYSSGRSSARRTAYKAAATLVGVSGLALAVAGVDAASSVAKSATATKTVTLGMDWSLSGVFAPYGVPAIDGVKLAEKQINAAGGIQIGKTTYKLGLDVMDDQSTPQTSNTNATKMIEDDHIKVIVGPIGNLATGVIPITAQGKAIDLSAASAGSIAAGTKPYPLVFATIAGNAYRASSTVPVIKHFLPHAKTVAIVGGNGAGNLNVMAALKKDLAGTGLTSQEFTYPTGTADLSTVMSQVASYNPNVIYECCTIGDLQAQTASYNSAGIGSNVVTIANGASYGDHTLVGDRPFIADPVQEADFTVPHPLAASLTFKREVAAYLGGVSKFSTNEVAVEFFYDSIKILAAAMDKAKSVTNTAAIAKAMREVRADGADGTPVGFNAHDTIQVGLDYTYVSASGQSSTFHTPAP